MEMLIHAFTVKILSLKLHETCNIGYGQAAKQVHFTSFPDHKTRCSSMLLQKLSHDTIIEMLYYRVR